MLQTKYKFSSCLFCITIREPRIWFMSPCISYMCFFYLIFLHFAINSLVGGDVIPYPIPSSIIHFSHALQRNALNGLFMPISTGWQSEVQPPGICSTSTPRSWGILDGILMAFHMLISEDKNQKSKN